MAFSLLLLLCLPLVLAWNNSNHLVVLSHGLMGSEMDLEYLASQLKKKGNVVLSSGANRLLASTTGVEAGAKRLLEEVQESLRLHPHVNKISFVGNSLGGIYARYAARLFKSDHVIMHKFMTVATPHLSVRDHIYLEEKLGPLPTTLKGLVASLLRETGRELFMRDVDNLLYRMSCDEAFLEPLRQFKERRLYANLDGDFMVPLGTAAFLDDDQVRLLREKHSQESGIVTVIRHEGGGVAECKQGGVAKIESMRAGLNSLQWDKHIVSFPARFPFSLLPLAHNKIAALRKNPRWLFTAVLGTSQGEPVMDHAAHWLSSE